MGYDVQHIDSYATPRLVFFNFPTALEPGLPLSLIVRLKCITKKFEQRKQVGGGGCILIYVFCHSPWLGYDKTYKFINNS